MNVKTRIPRSTFAILVVFTLILTMLPQVAFAQEVEVISGSPGDTISYSGMGTPDSKVRLELSTVMSIDTYASGDRYYYRSDIMKNVTIPADSSMSIMASPVDTLAVSDSITANGTVSGHIGTLSIDVPAGTYSMVVFGMTNGTPSPVSMTIRMSMFRNVSHEGMYTIGINTSGMPRSVYTVTQDGDIVAMVYLGVQAPATPTPSSSPSNAQGTSIPATTANPYGTDSDAWALYIVLMIFGSIIGVAAAYVLFVKKH